MHSLMTLLAAVAVVTSAPDQADHRRIKRTVREAPAPAVPRVAPPTADAPDGSCIELVQDGSFEQGTSSPWGQFSTNFGTPLCTVAECGNGGGTAFPRSGLWWAWFGGIGVFEEGALQQSTTIPLGTARLRFYLWIGARSGNGSDRLRVRIDNDTFFQAFESQPGFTSYQLVDIDVSAYANGASHQLRFESTTSGPNVTNFSVDDVSIQSCPFPVVSVADALNVTEADTGTNGTATFNVSLSEPPVTQVRVNWATGNATTGVQATAGADYTAASGTLTFDTGQFVLPLTVTVLGDNLDEHDERFALSLSSPTGATLGDPVGETTILDNDPLPSVSISDATVVEGHAGSTNAPLTVTLAPVSGRAVSGNFATADGTAIAGQDYTATSGGFTVAAGSTTAQLTVPVLGDTADETDEAFSATLQAADFATLADPLGVVTIDDDDGPSVAISDVTVTEGDAGTTPAGFALTLSAQSVQTVTVDFTTASGTATAGTDFTATSGTVTFGPGSTGADITVPVIGDLLDEPNEHFTVILSNPVDGQAGDTEAQGVIVDNDGGTLTLSGELSHGVEQWRALATAGARDVFVLSRPAWSSFEVEIDGASGDLGTTDGPNLRRLAPDLSTILQNSDPTGSGPARRLGVRNEQPAPEADYIEVTSAGCTTDCGADDVYRIRARETTLAAPRFNNQGGQVTVVLLQNRSGATLQGSLQFWSPTGALLATSPVSLAPTQSLSLSTASISELAGRSGAITATHDGPYGGLVGKAVAIEPATGFAFDTPLEPRRR